MAAYLPTTSMACTATEAAYGTWDWWVYWYSGDYDVNIAVVCSGPTMSDEDGYIVRMSMNNSLQLYRIDGGVETQLDATAAGVIPADSWVHIRATRSAAGAWKVYYDIGAGWVLGLDVTDDTYTESNAIVLQSFDTDVLFDLGNFRGDRAFFKWHGVVNPVP